MRRFLKVHSKWVRRVFQIEAEGNEYALIIATGNVSSWPGTNSFLVMLLDNELQLVDCEMIAKESVFATAHYHTAKKELTLYSNARAGGVMIQKMNVSSKGLTADEGPYWVDLNLGYSVSFTLGSPAEKIAEQDADSSRDESPSE